MSLIYQALKQTEQASCATPVAVAHRVSVVPAKAGVAAYLRRDAVSLGLLMAVVGLLIGVGFNLLIGVLATPAEAAHRLPADRTTGFAVMAPPHLQSESVALPLTLLPRAESPLPTVSPALKLAHAMPQSAKPVSRQLTEKAYASGQAASRDAEHGGVAADLDHETRRHAAESSSATLEMLEGADTPAPTIAAVNVQVTQPSAATVVEASVSVADLFGSLNRALANRDEPLAKRHLTAIQARLPEGSVARLRAEAWFSHQSGDVDGAGQIYRSLLNKLPGDEHAGVNLASIEKKLQRADRAKEVLSAALRHNPASVALRAALDQLALNRTMP